MICSTHLFSGITVLFLHFPLDNRSLSLSYLKLFMFPPSKDITPLQSSKVWVDYRSEILMLISCHLTMIWRWLTICSQELFPELNENARLLVWYLYKEKLFKVLIFEHFTGLRHQNNSSMFATLQIDPFFLEWHEMAFCWSFIYIILSQFLRLL